MSTVLQAASTKGEQQRSNMTIELGSLQTEGRNPNTMNIDVLSTMEIVQKMNQEDMVAVQAVQPCLSTVAAAVDITAPKVKKGGRIIYTGAGTSGRLGVLDASEIPPTYSAPKDQFVAMMAGGDYAIRNAVEGAEDSVELGRKDVANLNINPELDTVIGIAASGRTPYVLGSLEYAKEIGATTIGIACSSPSEMEISGNVDYMIKPITGPEVVTGSTRMKAGTATKLVLNMISTGIMIRIGKTCGNLMVDVKTSNLKLEERARRIVRSITGDKFFTCDANHIVDSEPQVVPQTPEGDKLVDQTIAACHGSVKLAIAVAKTGLAPSAAELELEVAGGVLANVLKQHARI